MKFDRYRFSMSCVSAMNSIGRTFVVSDRIYFIFASLSNLSVTNAPLPLAGVRMIISLFDLNCFNAFRYFNSKEDSCHTILIFQLIRLKKEIVIYDSR